MPDTYTFSDYSAVRAGDFVTVTATLTLPDAGWEWDLAAEGDSGTGSVLVLILQLTEPEVDADVITDYVVSDTFDAPELLTDVEIRTPGHPVETLVIPVT